MDSCRGDRFRGRSGYRPRRNLPSTKIGSAATIESMRSNTPPWPGNSAPESLTPAWRLTRLSNRSPTIENSTVTRASATRSEEHTSELQSHVNLVCRLLLEKKKNNPNYILHIIY